ncbi:MAG: UDP-glucose dehydrogenase family protein [Planctomycetota bacterium]|jgi:UDPglucose 6-dehydrogenase
MKVCVVGVGYVGLVTAAGLAEAGNNVICVDNDNEKIENLKKGIIPIYEPGLTELVRHNEKLNRLHFTTDLKFGLDNSLIIFLATGTPSSPDGSADLSSIFSVASDIAQHLTEYRIIATKSTVPVGTHKKVENLIKEKTSVSFDYISNPEFLKEGAAVEDFLKPERIIIGTNSDKARKIMAQLYQPLMRKSNRLVFMDPVSAEMTKYAANTMLATRISFMNELAQLCEKTGADIELVRQGIGSDSRIGRAFLFAGVGFGGSCFPKDIRALIHTGNQHNMEMKIASAVQQVNLNAHERFTQCVIDYFKDRAENTTLAVWGLAFKAKTDDTRESPAIFCIKKFLEAGFSIKAYDPEAAANAQNELKGNFQSCPNGYEALKDTDALVILTDWQEFRNPDFKKIADSLKTPIIFDGRNLYDLDIVKQAGLEYHSIGRSSVLKNT